MSGCCGSCRSWLALLAVACGVGCGDVAGTSESGEFPLDEDLFSLPFGGASEDTIRDMAVAPDGSLYVAGGTASPDFPTAERGFDRTFNGRHDAFVVKVTPEGRVEWSTFLGGPEYDRAYAIEVAPDGSLVVAGRAGQGFPVTTGALQETFVGSEDRPPYGRQDGFVCRLSSSDGRPIFCTYFGGAEPAGVRDVAVSASGEIFITTGTHGEPYPVPIAQAFTNAAPGGSDAVVARLASDGTRLEWATFLGGSRWESSENSVRVNADGEVFVLLTTESPDAPTTVNAASRALGGDQDVYVARLDATTGGLVWATFLGGEDNESTETHELAAAATGWVVVAVPTKSTDLHVAPTAVQRTYGGGGNDVLVARLASADGRLEASTFVGADGFDRAEGIDVDEQGNVCFTGTTTSIALSTTAGARSTTLSGDRDAIAFVLSPMLDRVVYASYLGGDGDEFGRAMAAAPDGVLYVGGQTTSREWLMGSGTPHSRARGAGADAFVVRLSRPTVIFQFRTPAADPQVP